MMMVPISLARDVALGECFCIYPCIASAGVLTRNKSPRVQCCVNQANALVLSVGSNCCRVSSRHTAAPAY